MHIMITWEGAVLANEKTVVLGAALDNDRGCRRVIPLSSVEMLSARGTAFRALSSLQSA